MTIVRHGGLPVIWLPLLPGISCREPDGDWFPNGLGKSAAFTVGRPSEGQSRRDSDFTGGASAHFLSFSQVLHKERSRNLLRHPSLKVIHSTSAARRLIHSAPNPVVLVPTMGALHRGHTALIDRARSLAGPHGTVVVSIFVNPTQFGPKEDFSRYPRPFAADRKLCAEHGADLLHPTPDQMYPDGFSTYARRPRFPPCLCGASRPGHFPQGVGVVLKLFQIVQPQIAVFGLKDFQQCAVIRRMVRDLDLPVRIVAAKTVREPDGLALSSRNQYLNAEERKQAPVLRAALLAARRAWKNGETSAAQLRQMVVKKIGTHDTTYMKVDRAVMNKRLFEALKPGGVLLIADHSARPGEGTSVGNTTHRIEESVVKREVEAAGFKLVGEGNFGAIPKTPRRQRFPCPDAGGRIRPQVRKAPVTRSTLRRFGGSNT